MSATATANATHAQKTQNSFALTLVPTIAEMLDKEGPLYDPESKHTENLRNVVLLLAHAVNPERFPASVSVRTDRNDKKHRHKAGKASQTVNAAREILRGASPPNKGKLSSKKRMQAVYNLCQRVKQLAIKLQEAEETKESDAEEAREEKKAADATAAEEEQERIKEANATKKERTRIRNAEREAKIIEKGGVEKFNENMKKNKARKSCKGGNDNQQLEFLQWKETCDNDPKNPEGYLLPLPKAMFVQTPDPNSASVLAFTGKANEESVHTFPISRTEEVAKLLDLLLEEGIHVYLEHVTPGTKKVAFTNTRREFHLTSAERAISWFGGIHSYCKHDGKLYVSTSPKAGPMTVGVPEKYANFDNKEDFPEKMVSAMQTFFYWPMFEKEEVEFSFVRQGTKYSVKQLSSKNAHCGGGETASATPAASGPVRRRGPVRRWGPVRAAAPPSQRANTIRADSPPPHP